MKMLTITPVPEPKSFAGVKFTKEEWEAATDRGPSTHTAGTAQENCRNSKGLYQIVPEKEVVEVRAEIRPEEMSNMELIQMAASFGKPPRKKMKRSALIDFVKTLLADAVNLVEDD